MGRWTQHDEDSERLPEGMERIGYDSDTGRYSFRDRSGAVYEGAQGARYSQMTRVSGGAASGMSSAADDDLEAAPRRVDGYQPLATDSGATGSWRTHAPNAGAYRTLFPFFLVIGVVLLLVWRLILAPGLAPAKDPCPTGAEAYLVEPGDSCWEISRVHGCSLDELKKWNAVLECERLMPGMTLCLPLPTTE